MLTVSYSRGFLTVITVIIGYLCGIAIVRNAVIVVFYSMHNAYGAVIVEIFESGHYKQGVL